MNQTTSRRNSLFLIELIIAILFFSLASALCVQLYVKSHTISTAAMEESRSAAAASNIADALRDNPISPGESLALVYSEMQINSTDGILYFDSYFSPCTESKSDGYTLLVTWQYPTDNMLSADITVYKNADSTDHALYTLTIEKHIAKERN